MYDNRIKALKKIQQYINIEPILLLISFFICLFIAPLVALPYSNPYQISSQFGASGFNPDNNFYAIVFVVAGALALFTIFRKVHNTRFSYVIKAAVIFALIVNYSLVNLVPTPGYSDPAGFVDNFHAGEQLSAASEFMSGRGLYSDTFYLRGAGVDAIVPALGMQLLGKSIGSFILTMDAMEIFALISFLVLLAFVVRNVALFTIAAVGLYTSEALSLIQFRDIAVWCVFGLMLFLFRERFLRNRFRLGLLYLIGLVAALELYVAIDRGVLLVALASMLAATLSMFGPESGAKYIFAPRLWRRNVLQSAMIIMGLGTGMLLPAIFMGSTSFWAFLKMTFLEIPAYGGLLVSQPFPSFAPGTYMFWGPVIISVATGYLLIRLYGAQQRSRNYNKLLPYTLLLVFGVLCLKAGANRIALSKLASVTAPLILICLLIVGYAITLAIKDNKRAQLLAFPIILCALAFGVFAQIDTNRVVYMTNPTRAEIASYKNMRHRSDDSWLSPETQAVAQFIRSRTNAEDSIYSFTSNPIYYYLADRRNPSRFNVSWFADPQPYTNELLESLKANKPKLVVYKEGTWMDAPDNIRMEDRIPEVNEWLLAKYPNRKIIGNTTLLLP